MQFTEEQLRAIKTRDTNILVSAGAGSGKTGVLTERILDRLRDGDSINELLVLTYTKAAAAEMRSRIRSKIADALAMSQGTEREHWEKQMMFLSDAPITTLHSFCLRLLRRHYQMIPGLDPDFRILDPNQASVHRQDLLKAFLEECYMEPEEEKRERFFTVLRSYGTRLSDEGLKKEILHLIEFGRPQGDLEQWLRQMLRRFGDVDFWHRQVSELAEQELRIVIDTLKGALRDCRANGGPVKYEETLSQDIKALEELSGSDWDTWRNAAPFGTLGRAKKDDNVAVREYVKSRRDAAKTYFKNKILPFFQKDFSHYVREISCCYSEMETLVELTLAFHERYQSYKLKQKFLEFTDLELYAYRLLQDHEEIRERYRNDFREVLIDEYQDINPLQEQIISLLCRENNLFVVGDIKQSIYGFRFADHTLFRRRYDSYSKENGKGAGLKILLNRNFRSHGDILQAVNFFFSQWMNPAASQMPYGEDEALIPGAQYSEAGGPVVESILIHRPEEGAEKDFDDAEKIHYHGRYIASRIEQMMTNGMTVTDHGEERPLCYGDIAILIRSAKGKASALEDDLTLRAIPVSGPGARHFIDTPEVRLFISLLDVLDNPCQDIPLAALLRSPFFAFDENELMALAHRKKGERLWIRLQYCKNHSTEGVSSEKVASFLQRVEQWRGLAKIYPVGDLSQMLMRNLHYEAFWGGLPGGALRRRNLAVLQEKAMAFQETNSGGLFDFLRYLRNLEKNEADLVSDHAENSDAVKIMTIHGSKGLEFPVVFVADLNIGFNRQETREPLILHDTLGFGPKYKDWERRISMPTLPRLLIQRKRHLADVAESLRLFYVAMTRAKEKLIFTSASDRPDETERIFGRSRFCDSQLLPAEQVISASSMMQWLYCGLSRWSTKCLPYENFSCSIVSVPALPPQTETFSQKKVSGFSPPPGGLERLKAVILQKGGKPLPAKVSVTDLLPKIFHGKAEIHLPAPKFLQKTVTLTGAERGTAFHQFMEFLPLDRLWNPDSLKKIRETFLAEQLMTEKMLEAVDDEAILGFFREDFGRDVLSAVEVRRELHFTGAFPADVLLENGQNDTMILQGAIDMIYRRKDGSWILVDYKTNRLTPEREKDFLRHYGRQMELYAMALAKLFDIKVSQSVFYLAAEHRFLPY